MQRFYLAVDCQKSKADSLNELLRLLVHGHSIVVACGSRVSLDTAVSSCIASLFTTVVLIDDSELDSNLAAAKRMERMALALVVTDAVLDTLPPHENLSLKEGARFLVNFDLSRSKELDEKRILMVFGSTPLDRRRGVVIDMFCSSEVDRFREIESSNGQDIPPLPMTLEDLLF